MFKQNQLRFQLNCVFPRTAKYTRGSGANESYYADCETNEGYWSRLIQMSNYATRMRPQCCETIVGGAFNATHHGDSKNGIRCLNAFYQRRIDNYYIMRMRELTRNSTCRRRWRVYNRERGEKRKQESRRVSAANSHVLLIVVKMQKMCHFTLQRRRRPPKSPRK